ncbi:maltose acetyltransferase domain-containing protein [Vibrio cholerae]|uniref:maltose acetyltransferase domain-containing protein n=1 Tax=Vibrio cholerae TaxID=666 RepID=UPI0013B3FB56|nr:maltose acetyltransferase domain-containing protein [Vibrio cholerae]
MSELEKMLKGEHFDGASAEIEALRSQAGRLKLEINQSLDEAERYALQRELFGHLGHKSCVQPPFHCELANSVVNQDVPPDTLVGGTPARILRSLKDPAESMAE